ncbi:MAG: hypothetical protein HY510_00740 [Acidobacteria bacterium]|nr:hypothetical protein [Acidobacteriota bacterium]
MIEYLSPREQRDLLRAAGEGEPWARVIRDNFLDGARVILGIESARSERAIAAAAGIDPDGARAAIAGAARWCGGRRLHLLGFAGERPAEEWRHFLAVG